jgi:hypothetical protein
MTSLPFYIPLTFAIAIALTIFFFTRATQHSRIFLFIALALLVLQSIVSLSGFYAEPGQPLRFLLLLPPPLIAAILYSTTASGRSILEAFDIKTLVLLHIIRIPVELTLYWLSRYHLVPVAMTFEGRNFDILTGLTAPLIYYFGFIRKTLSIRVIVAWNWIGIALLLFVVSNAFRFAFAAVRPDLAAASPALNGVANATQPLALPQVPWVLLPGFLVPIVLTSHFITLRGLLTKNNLPLLSSSDLSRS